MSETAHERNTRIFQEATAAGEPVFVLRAKDLFAPPAIEHYGVIVARARGLGFDPAFGLALDDVLSDFQRWREVHRDEIKMPDVRP